MSSFEVWMDKSFSAEEVIECAGANLIASQIYCARAERGQIVVSGAVNLAECLFAFTLATLRIVSINCFAVSRERLIIINLNVCCGGCCCAHRLMAHSLLPPLPEMKLFVELISMS
jgi:hypothetical protein